jgi:hypothetical protein
MPDPFATYSDSVGAPATRVVVVTPHDSTALTDIPKALYVGTAGNITMRGVNGTSDAVWKNVPAGTTLPFRAQFIRATGTTAADILALY